MYKKSLWRLIHVHEFYLCVFLQENTVTCSGSMIKYKNYSPKIYKFFIIVLFCGRTIFSRWVSVERYNNTKQKHINTLLSRTKLLITIEGLYPFICSFVFYQYAPKLCGCSLQAWYNLFYIFVVMFLQHVDYNEETIP